MSVLVSGKAISHVGEEKWTGINQLMEMGKVIGRKYGIKEKKRRKENKKR